MPDAIWIVAYLVAGVVCGALLVRFSDETTFSSDSDLLFLGVVVLAWPILVVIGALGFTVIALGWLLRSGKSDD